MEWEHNMDYQPRQQLANALDLSSRLAQREQTKQQQQQRSSSLFNALCDSQDNNRNQEHENDNDEDWRRYLKSNTDIPLTDPLFGNNRQNQQNGQQQGHYWNEGSKWSTRTSTSGCMSLNSSDIPFSDIPEIAWDCSSLSTCSDLFPLVDCSYSITTNPDFDTHSELGYKHNKMMMHPMPHRGLRYASSDISSTDVLRGTGSVRTSSSLPFTTGSYARNEKLKQRHRTLTYSADSTQCQPPIIHELQPFNEHHNDFDRRRTIENMMQTVDLNGQLDIIRIIDPSVDIEQLKKAIIKIPLHQPIDDFKFNKIKDYVAQTANSANTSPSASFNSGFRSNPPPPVHSANTTSSTAAPSTSAATNSTNGQTNGLRRSNSDPNLVELVNTQKAADKRKERDMVIRQRRIFRWLNSQKSQTARRQRQLERERRRPDLFQKQEVVEVQKDETIDEQNEEIDVCA